MSEELATPTFGTDEKVYTGRVKWFNNRAGYGFITVNTLANIFVPIINPTLKMANFGPNIFVSPKDNIVNKIIMVETNKKSFLISLDLHRKS